MENIKTWLKKCEILKEEEIEYDYLGPDVDSNFSLEENTTPNPIISRNVLGTKTTRQRNFTLSGRFSFDTNNTKINYENMQIMKTISEWIIQQELKHNYPELNEEETCIRIDITSSPFLYGLDKSLTYSRYNLQFKITYEKRES